MDRVRASSLESNKNPTEKFESYQRNLGRNKIQSLISNRRDTSDDSAPIDYYSGRESKRPVVPSPGLKDQLDLLQCTVNKMLNIGAFDEISSSCQSVNISDALKHEYCQMMSALKELENILSVKRKNVESVSFSGASSTNDSQVHQLQREIYYRDSLIKCLSDRLKVLCKANDKLIIDYENQENLLSEELLCLKRQLEKAKDALRALSIMKKRPSVSSSQDTDSEIYYLRESMCTKEMMISDLKHRIDRLGRENAELKCELENKEESVSLCVSSQFDRDMSYMKRSNDQMNEQIDTLTNSLNLKNRLIEDLQRQLECRDDTVLIRNLREEYMLLNDENELHKDEILEQSDILDDFRNQLKMMSENNQFKDETIEELKCCLRKLTDSISGVAIHEERVSQSNDLNALLNSVKGHLNQRHPNLLRLLGSENDPYHTLENFILELLNIAGKNLNQNNITELFKEFLTNEINLKNKIGRFLADNTSGNIESVDKLKNQMNSLMSLDMDDGFNNDLKGYLHQCFLLDDNLRLVIEYMVKALNNIPVRSTDSFHTNDRSTFIPLGEMKPDDCEEKRKEIEKELRILTKNYNDDKDRFGRELSEKERELSKCHRNMGDLEEENEKLVTENHSLLSKLKQMERDLNLRTTELENLELSMRKMSSRFLNISSSNENAKDAEIEKLSKELESLREAKRNLYELERLHDDEMRRISQLTKELEPMKELRLQNSELQHLINTLKKELEEKNELLRDKLAEEKRASRMSETLTSDMKKLQDENRVLSDKLGSCLEEKSKLDSKLIEVKSRMSEQENSKSLQLQSAINSLKLENKSLEMKSNSLTSDKTLLEDQIKQLRSQLNDLTKGCIENHVDKQKVIELEGILALMTEELNEKAGSLEDVRKMLQKQPSADLNAELKCDPFDQMAISQQLLAEKDSEIALLKAKLENCESRKSLQSSQVKFPSMNESMTKSEIGRLHQKVNELEARVSQLNQQLTDRSNNLANLQNLLKEKDFIIENANKMIKTKSDSLLETEKLMHLVSLQNTNIKDELSASYDGINELSMLKAANKNLNEEIHRLNAEIQRLKDALRNSINSEKSKKYKSQSFDLLPQKLPSVLTDNHVEQINEEIKKLYVNFEDKNKELKDYSLKEIQSRDRRLETLNLELKLKTDQMQAILIENKRLSDRIEDESQRSSRYEQTMLLKEQMLEKLLHEKEKIRATFITELRDKNEELTVKSKTVYFLNAELHRLSSDLEILNAELYTVKSSEKFHVTQKQTLEIVQAELDTLKEENSSLKFCVNLKMAEAESMRNELKIQQAGNQKLSSDHSMLKNEAQSTNDSLKKQLAQIKQDYDQMSDAKIKLQKALDDLNNENMSLKRVMEELENEKVNYRDEVEKLRRKIEALTNDLMEAKDKIAAFSGDIEREQHLGRRLSEAMELSEQAAMVRTDELKQALLQIDELVAENMTFKHEVDRLQHIISELEDRGREGDIKIRSLASDNDDMMKELHQYDNLKKQLDECIDRKSMDCEELRLEREKMMQMLDQYHQEIDNLKNRDQIKYQNLQENFDGISAQLAIAEERYGLLRLDFEKLEGDYHQQKHLCDTVTQNCKILETTADSQCQEILCLNEKNQELMVECSRLELENLEIKRLQCDNYSLRNINEQMSSQIQTLSAELVASHAEVWTATSKINENQATISNLCSRLNNKLVSDRRYGSQPLLNATEPYSSDCGDLEQRDYNDLKTRYNALCSQIDNMVCQLKKKDKRVCDLENELSTFSRTNYVEMKDDFCDLEKRYHQLEKEYAKMNQQYRSHGREQLHMQKHDVQVIQACTGELQETIDSQNQEIDQLKSSHQMLENDYNNCCDKLVHLEKKIVLANAELGNWQKTYYHKTESFEADVNELRQENLNLLSAIGERNQLKQELIDLRTRMTDVMNCNDNLEQQSLSYRQKIINQAETIEELKCQLNNMETYYEQEVEQCRKDLSVIKGNDRLFSTDFSNEMKATKAELNELHNQYNLQCGNYDQLKEDLEHQTMAKEELQQLLHDQSQNIEQLSAQLFNNRDIIEQLTAENHRLVNVVEESTFKIDQLLEKVQKSEEYLNRKNMEIEDGKRNIEMLENNLSEMENEKASLCNQVEEFTEHLEHSSEDHHAENDRLKKELEICYQMVDKLQCERSKLIEDVEKMSLRLPDKKLGSETSKTKPVSIKELRSIDDKNSRLSSETKHSVDSQRNSENVKLTLLSPSPNSDYLVSEGNPDNFGKDEIDQSGVSDVTYSSSKSVTWKSTHTDQKEDETGSVLALQQAIEDYSNLVTDLASSNKQDLKLSEKGSTKASSNKQDVKLSEKGSTKASSNKQDIKLSEKVSTKASVTKPPMTIMDKKKSVTSESQNVEIIVEMEFEIPFRSFSNESYSLSVTKNVSVESIDRATSVNETANSAMAHIIQLLKNNNINLEYDEGKETFNEYFKRVMDRYKELEQFFLASMKIQFSQPLNDDTMELFENFNKNLEDNRGILNEHCRQLNKMLVFATSDSANEVTEMSANQISSDDYINLISLVKKQQMQMIALNVIFNNLNQISPFESTDFSRAQIPHLSEPYEMVWLDDYLCCIDISHNTTTISQSHTSIKETVPKSQKYQSLILTQTNVQNDSILQKNDGQKNISEMFEPPKISQSCSSLASRALQSQSTTLCTSELRSHNVSEDSVENRADNNLSQSSSKIDQSKRREESVSISMSIYSSESRVTGTRDNFTEKITTKEPSFMTLSFHSSKDEHTRKSSSLYQETLSKLSEKYIPESVVKPTISQSQLSDQKQTQSVILELHSSESREKNAAENVNQMSTHDTRGRVLSLEHVREGGLSNQGEVQISLNMAIDTVQYKRDDGEIGLDLEVIETKEKQKSFDSVKKSLNLTFSNDSFNINEMQNVVESSPGVINEQQSVSVLIKNPSANNETRPTFLQNVSEGLSINEGKTISMEKLEDNLRYASVGHYEKAMHQLNDIDFDNLDPNIDHKSRMRIYAAEIDYLNEKNLFHTYAIDVLTDPSRNLYNFTFLDHVNNSLVTKAKHLHLLQKEFNFDPHISTKEKTLIHKILNSDYTYKKMFDEWMNLQRVISAAAPIDHVCCELQLDLEKCRLTRCTDTVENERLIREIQAEKEALKIQLQQMTKIVEEAENIKRQTTLQQPSASKQDAKVTNTSVSKQSKIPLMKGSNIEGPSSHHKVSLDVPPKKQPQPTPTKFGGISKQSKSTDPFVTPNEVKLAISGEMDIDNLKHFANLLAEDNFDLANEIEKLLSTIEELRKQLKENCEILSETVEMLQNSENFVNDSEKQLAVETKKTQIISNRVDKLNDLNKQVVVELQRILKDNAPISNAEMETQERCNYLLECLKKIEVENLQLKSAKEELVKELKNVKSSGEFSFLGPDLPDGVNFDFETTLLSNGSIIGAINFAHAKDVSKNLALTFDVLSKKAENRQSVMSMGPQVGRFTLETDSNTPGGRRSLIKEPARHGDRSQTSNDNNNNDNNNINNNSCYKVAPATAASTHRSILHCLPYVSLANSSDDLFQSKYAKNRLEKSFPHFPIGSSERWQHRSDDGAVGLGDGCHRWTSMCSLSADNRQKNLFINYRTPIYFRRVRDSM